MREWFNAQTPRDQIALIALAAAVVIYSVVAFALVPASEARSQMMANNKAATAQLARVEAKVSQLVDLRANGESAQNAGLTVKRLQPNSRGEVQVRFESVEFDALLQWLQTIEGNEGLRIIDASVSDAGRSGGVNATLRVREQ
jgi:type II secretory pathway component PulM